MEKKSSQYRIIYLIISTEYCLIFKICTLSLVNSHDRWIVCATHSGQNCTLFVQIAHCGLHRSNYSEMQCKPPSFCRREREGGWEREKGVTRIQFITSEAAGTQPTMHTGRDVQNAQQFAQRTICKMHNLHNGHSEWQGHMCHCTATFCAMHTASTYRANCAMHTLECAVLKQWWNLKSNKRPRFVSHSLRWRRICSQLNNYLHQKHRCNHRH